MRFSILVTEHPQQSDGKEAKISVFIEEWLLGEYKKMLAFLPKIAEVGAGGGRG